jgi:hypothetical protein
MNVRVKGGFMSEKEARKTIEAYIEAFNAQDLAAMKDKLNFPFSWIINSTVRPVQDASDFVSPTAELIKREGWHHTVLDRVEPVQVWEKKAHMVVVYSRFKADGTQYTTHEAMWIVTRQKDHWGIQCMSLYIP